MKILPIFIIFLLLPTIALAATFPQPTGFVNDYANVLGNRTSDINQLLINVQKETTAEVVVVTMNSSDVQDSNSYATELFNAWGIGKKDKDNGLLIFLDVYNRRIEVETGYGIEGILNDAKVGRILDKYAVDYLKQGNYSEGAYSAAVQLSNVIMENKEEVLSGQAGGSSFPDPNTFIFFIFVFSFAGSIITSAFRRIFLKKCPYCGGKARYVKTEIEGDYDIIYYKCKKCGKTFQEKKKRVKRYHGIIVGGMGGRGGGFGGFGGGGSGGGGAGRGF